MKTKIKKILKSIISHLKLHRRPFLIKTVYTEAPKSISMEIAEGEVVSDFLPPPEELIRKEPKVKITITLNSGSVDFFKKFAKKNSVKYQTMINEVLDKYVQKYKDRITV